MRIGWGTGRWRRRRLVLPGVVTVVALTAAACGSSGGPNGAAVKQFSLKTKNSEPVRITSGPDGHMWFAEQRANKIARLNPDGHLTEFAIPFSAPPAPQPYGVVTGPDGNLWFTEQGQAKIGRLTPTGSLTEFKLPA